MFLGTPGLGIGRTFRAGGGFSPADIPGLALWLDPSDAGGYVLTSGRVSQLTDKSGAARHFTQVTAGLRPVIQAAGINGKDTVLYNAAATEHLIGPSFSALTGGGEVLVITKLNAGADSGGVSNGLWQFGSAAEAGFYPHSTGDIVYDSFGSTTRQAVGNPTPSLESPRCFSCISTSTEWTARLDGAQLFTTAINAVGWDPTSYLGRTEGLGGPAYLPGQTGELLIYNRKLTTAERADVQGYLGPKWGVTFA